MIVCNRGLSYAAWNGCSQLTTRISGSIQYICHNFSSILAWHPCLNHGRYMFTSPRKSKDSWAIQDHYHWLSCFCNCFQQLLLNSWKLYAQIWREGQLTAEYKRMPVKTRLNTWSACKGVVSCAAGIALDEGLIRLDEKIVDIFPEYAPENPEGYLGDVTLENMLTMTTGLESSLFFCDWPERYTTPDWIRYFFENAKVIKKPGTEWLYSNFNTYMISCAIEKRAGVNLLEYLRNRFFEPLGIGNPDWTLCPKGHVHAANGLYVNIDEFTRYGQMILHKGNYNGKQLVPESYMKMATSNLVDNSVAGSPGNLYSGFGYGYHIVLL